MKLRLGLLFLIAMLVLVACGGTEQEQAANTTLAGEPAAAEAEMAGDDMATEPADMADEAMADESMADETSAEHDVMAEETMAEADDMAGADLPAWQQIAVTNVRTGESFTLADFAGKTVFVEPMATWCTNCRRQLGNVQQARAQLSGEDVVFVALSVETNLSDAQLAEYTNSTGFDWVFAVMTPEMLQAMADQFGRTIANPPSTPHFVIRPDGSTTDLVTGIEPAEAIISHIRAAQG